MPAIVRDAAVLAFARVLSPEAASPALIEKLERFVTDGSASYSREPAGRHLCRHLHPDRLQCQQREGGSCWRIFTAPLNATRSCRITETSP